MIWGIRVAEIWAFSADNVRQLTGVSGRQLSYWAATSFFRPAFVDEYRRRPFGRVYSFRDVVGLRVIAILRKEHNVPLQALRKVGEWLSAEHETPWASLRFAVAGRHVLFYDPRTGELAEPSLGRQKVFAIAVEPIANEMSTAASRLRDRKPDQIGQLARNRYVVHNAWVIAGTRVPTSAIWNLHEAGYTLDRIIREYPRLRPGDVRRAIVFESKRQKSKRHRVA